jgi:perosamine synthetase
MTEPIQFARPYCFEEEAEAAAEAVRSGWIVGGPRLREFEQRFADYCGMAEAVGVSSWTTGAFLVLHSWGIGPGDEVIVPSLSFIATANAVVHTGASPVFAEIDPRTWNIDPEDAARRVTARTKAIIPVDQIGLPCEIDAINDLSQRHGLRVLQDCACAIGSRYHGRPVGGLSEVSIFSLHARKVITTGEGGMILTDDTALAERLRRLRHQGMSLSDLQRAGSAPTLFESYDEIGYNYRMTDIQAAIGLVQFDRLDTMLENRRMAAEHDNRALANSGLFELPHAPAGLTPNWQSYMVAVRPDLPVTRDGIMERLHERGISTRRGVMATHLEPAYAHVGASLPHTEDIARRGLQLPMHAGLSAAEVTRVTDGLAEIAEEAAGNPV